MKIRFKIKLGTKLNKRFKCRDSLSSPELAAVETYVISLSFRVGYFFDIDILAEYRSVRVPGCSVQSDIVKDHRNTVRCKVEVGTDIVKAFYRCNSVCGERIFRHIHCPSVGQHLYIVRFVCKCRLNRRHLNIIRVCCDYLVSYHDSGIIFDRCLLDLALLSVPDRHAGIFRLMDIECIQFLSDYDADVVGNVCPVTSEILKLNFVRRAVRPDNCHVVNALEFLRVGFRA